MEPDSPLLSIYDIYKPKFNDFLDTGNFQRPKKKKIVEDETEEGLQFILYLITSHLLFP